MGAEKNPLHTPDINTGTTFTLMYLRKIHSYPLFNGNVGIYNHVILTTEHILNRKKIITHKWEELSKEERQFFQEENERSDTRFLHPRIYKEKGTNVAIPAFDVVFYNSPCILTYEHDNQYQEFRLFFALKITFTDIADMHTFLNYQLKKNFNNNMDTYCQFLDETLLAEQDKMEAGPLEKVRRYIKENTPSTETVKMDKDEAPVYITKIPDVLPFKTTIKEYSPKELYGLYNMKEKLFRSYMRENIHEIGKLGKSRIYTPKQVYIIFCLLGDPALRNIKY